MLLRLTLTALAVFALAIAVLPPDYFDDSEKPHPANTPSQIDTAREQFVFTWSARDGEPPAAELSLRALPTDWYAWWWSQTRTVRELPPDGPNWWVMEVSVPNADAILPEDMAPLCTPNESPLKGCAGARARIMVFRDGGDSDRTEVLLGRRAPDRYLRVTQDGRTVPVIHEFWTRHEKGTGRERFLGWQCQEGSKDLPLPASAQARPRPLYSCFEPSSWWERQWPTWFGFQRNRLYTACKGEDDCEMNFLFAARQVRLEFVDLMPTKDRELARFRLLLSAWEMLNRQRRDASHPAEPTAELAEARVQLAMCENAADEFVKLPAQRPWEMTDSQRQRLSRLSIFCERAANIASRMMPLDAKQSEVVLDRAKQGLDRMGIRRGKY